MKLLQQCFLFFIVVVIPGHNLGNSQVSVNRTIGPTLVLYDIIRIEKGLHVPHTEEVRFACRSRTTQTLGTTVKGQHCTNG